ncbi:cell wall-binding repeat-containing protein [Peptostreptococcus anaerobius]|uniref:cell wall-binding repeat-containing protein n=1 Tax=Peptostreptococcus anaerobius TaxID=1261 RepID=UPI00189B3D27|nr:cell wall-binding repeat-containing protein [Peptostreptococcus anaerobius]MDB8852519.1 cell wall-binding repeat-containing protein [Peptostreptococcus anaerobius]
MVKGLRKSLILSCVLALFLPSVASADMNVSRIAGANRYETALKVQQKYFTKASGNLAVLASGTDFRTALYGSYMANALKVPFYAIPNTGMSRVMLDELKRTNVKNAYIMGNDKILNNSINNSLKSIDIKYKRFHDQVKIQDGYNYFSDRLSSMVDWTIFSTFNEGYARGDISCNIIVNDTKFPDLLSSVPFTSTLAREQKMGLVGYNSSKSEYLGSDGYGFIIGGYDSVPESIKTGSIFDNEGLGLYYHSSVDPDGIFFESYTGRIAGQNRYKTAIEIAKAYKPVLKRSIDTVVLVDGTNYPDALASGTVATMNNGVIILTEPGKLNEDTKAFIQENNIQNVIIVGGEKSVSKNVENELRGL